MFDENGKILQGVIIRHLILPLCTDDSIMVLREIKKNFPNTNVSLMSQYIPMHIAKTIKHINRKITKREYEKVKSEFLGLNLCGYFQDLCSASSEFVPQFKFIS